MTIVYKADIPYPNCKCITITCSEVLNNYNRGSTSPNINIIWITEIYISGEYTCKSIHKTPTLEMF